MYFVYVLKSKLDGKLYMGYTNDLKKRFYEHTNGFNKSTKYRAPFRLVYYEAFLAEADARLREKKIKQFKNSYGELKKRIHNSIDAA